MSGTSESLRVCIAALNAYPAVDPQSAGPIGGIETQAWMFARGLGQRGEIDVSMFVRHTRPPRQDEFEGVTLIPLVDRLYGIRQSVGMCVGKQRHFPWLTLHRWRMALLWQFPLVVAERLLHGRPGDPWRPESRLMDSSFDVYCTFGVQAHSATMIATAHAAGRPAILFLGSDGDLDENYQENSDYDSPYGDRGDVCWRILREADSIIVQTAAQQQLLRERFGRDGVVIENPIDVCEWDARVSEPLGDVAGRFNRYVLWVGRAEDVHKRPDVCLELARLCPAIDFLMILNPRDPVVESRVRRETPGNVHIVSHVPFPMMPAVFAQAAALVNTSSLEGFPNVFLQAAVSSVPIASLNVGESFLEWLDGGRHADGDVRQLALYLQQVWDCPESGLNDSRERVMQRYGIEPRIDELVEVLRSSVQGKASAGDAES